MKLLLKNISSFSLILLLVLGTSILVRLPHFLSDDFFFDGDEAMIGIMAQDFLSGKGLPIYFYGQNYGFSSIEVLSTAFFIKVLGSGIWALRLGGLLLFSIGLTFIWKTLNETKTSKLISLIVLLMLIAAPTWFLWGGMVRGGYITAFMCFGILFYVTQLKLVNWKWMLILSIISTVSYASQPLIFIPMLPFVINWFLPLKVNYKKIVGFGLLSALMILILHYFGSSNEVWSAPKSTFFDIQQLENLKTQTEGMIYGYSNFFFFTMNIPISWWWFILLLISLVIITVYTLIFFVKSQKENKGVVVMMIFSLLISVFLVSSVSMYSPRYWLGFFTGILFLFCYEIIHGDFLKKRLMVAFAVAGIYSLGIIASRDMKRDWYFVDGNEMKMISQFYDEVKDRDIKAVFITDPVVQWKWNYLFGRSIPGTFFSEKERTNEFRDLAFETLEKTPDKTAIIGLFGNYAGLDEEEAFKAKIDQVALKYYIVEKVNKSLIKETVLRLK